LKIDMMKKTASALAAGLLAAAGSAFAAPTVDVLHYWTSGSEARSLNELKTLLQKEGVVWKDAPVAGGTGMNAVQVLHARVAAGDPPAAVQLQPSQIATWGKEGQLRDLDDIAIKNGWDKIISPELIPYLKVDKQYVAVPVDVHRNNWLWYNKKVFDKLGLAPPKTWDEFNAVGDKLKAAGVIPLALGGQPWQELDLFENLVLGIGGPDFYRKALVQQDESALRSPIMVKVFTELRKLNDYVDPNYPGRDWNLATAMLIQGKAAMQIQGDWAKGEMLLANKKANVDYGCVPAPGTAGDFIWIMDAFSFFKSKNADKVEGQTDMATAVLDKNFQEAFSVGKGSIPARVDVSSAKFDECGKQSFVDRTQAQTKHTTIPSLAHNAAASEDKTGVFLDTISSFFESKGMSPQQGIDRLVSGLQSLQ
jgi:glucose/mannose transport system substrate-binding protein